MGFFPPGYVHKPCETCKYCGGWEPFAIRHPDEGYDRMRCKRPGAPSVNTLPERGCAYWREAPEIALGYYD